MRTVLLLVCSNVFMTVAWYGHLKFKHWPLVLVIALSWLIALPEYALQVPANRYGYGRFSANQLKIIQEAISIAVFMIFAAVILAVSGKPVVSATDAPVAAQSSESPLEIRR
jgi:uncharacterized protein (DUF486 family)